MYLKRKLNRASFASIAVTAVIAAAALTATSASASVGQIGPFQVSDPWVYCSMSFSGTSFWDTLRVTAPKVYAMPGYTQQRVGWEIRAFRVQSDGSLQYVTTVYGNGGYPAWATPTTAANLGGQISLSAANLFGSGRIKIALDIFWFDAAGQSLGTFTGVYANYYENMNGSWISRANCQL